MAWVVLLLFAFALGVALVVLGLRGRRVDDHRLCRRCGYDLTGNPDATICNECGRDLTRAQAVRLGHRRRRPMAIGGGLALLVPALLVGGVVVYLSVADVDLQRLKPVWLLQRDLATGGQSADDAEAELRRRYTADPEALGDEGTVALVDRILARQADPTTAWDVSADGGFVEAARVAGDVSDEQWGQFGLNAFEVALNLRPRVRHGDPLPAYVGVDKPNGWRGGPKFEFHGYTDNYTLRIGDLKRRREPGDLTQFYIYQFGSGYAYGTIDRDLAASDLPLGDLEATVEGRIRIAEGPKRDYDYRDEDKAFAPYVLAEARFRATASTHVDPADAPANVTTLDPRLKHALEASIAITGLSPWEGSENQWDMQVSHRQPPVDTHWAVWVRPAGSDDSAWRLVYESLRSSAGTNQGHGVLMGGQFPPDRDAPPPDLTGLDAVDIELRPNVEAALRGVDLGPIWGGTLRFENVEVAKEPRPTTWPEQAQVPGWGVNGKLEGTLYDWEREQMKRQMDSTVRGLGFEPVLEP